MKATVSKTSPNILQPQKIVHIDGMCTAVKLRAELAAANLRLSSFCEELVDQTTFARVSADYVLTHVSVAELGLATDVTTQDIYARLPTYQLTTSTIELALQFWLQHPALHRVCLRMPIALEPLPDPATGSQIFVTIYLDGDRWLRAYVDEGSMYHWSAAHQLLFVSL